jgi:hypothetical protein
MASTKSVPGSRFSLGRVARDRARLDHLKHAPELHDPFPVAITRLHGLIVRCLSAYSGHIGNQILSACDGWSRR